MQLKQAVAGKAFFFLLPPKGILYLGERSSLHFCQLYGVLDQGFYINLFVFQVHSQKVWLMEWCRKVAQVAFTPIHLPSMLSFPSQVFLEVDTITISSHQKSCCLQKSRKRDSEVKEITNRCQAHWRIQGRLDDVGQRKAIVWESDSHVRK